MKPSPPIPGKTGHYEHDCILEGMAEVSAASKGLTDAGLVVLHHTPLNSLAWPLEKPRWIMVRDTAPPQT